MSRCQDGRNLDLAIRVRQIAICAKNCVECVEHRVYGRLADADFHFCGGKTVPGRPYCPDHCARAYLPRTADKSQAA
jgi:hypothetical protein